ncbi:hypothetical protein ACHQM5_016072 [Ranunculus cassubicifolius]
MGESKKKNKKKKISIAEDDISSLLRRYSAKTIIALLQEVSQFPDAKIDWKVLVEKSKTGIKNAREYQMVWRHMAYRDTLLENVDDAAQVVADDSDLEIDLEAVPAVNAETYHEAAACAKILLGSGLPIESDAPPTVEGPLKINIPVPSATSESGQGKDIIIPVIIQKHKGKDKSGKDKSSKDGTCPADEEGGASAACGPRRKRKPWTEEEDLELIAAVQKCGERNWANIVKGDFKGDRTPSQLSQRWSIIKKKQNIVGFAPSTTQLTEAQLATRRAVSHALNMPMVNNLLAACSSGATQPTIPSNSATIPCGLQKSTIPSSSSVPEKSIIPSTSPTVPENTPRTQHVPPHISNTVLKPKIPVAAKKGPPVPFKSTPSPNPMIQATAVAAGARIAPPSTAASLLKAAQSKNAVHIRPGGAGPIFKTTLAGGSKSSSTVHLGSHPNVHYIRTGLAPATAPARPAMVASSNLHAHEMGSDVEMKVVCPKNVAEEFVSMDEDDKKEILVIDKQPDNVSVPVKCLTATHMEED